MKVKCIDNKDTAEFLELLKIYTVESVAKIGGHDRYILKGVAGDWYAYRFQVVSEDLHNCDTIPSPSNIPQARGSTNEDAEEERLRRLLRPARLPNFCVCGIHRAQCIYHKD